MPTQTLSPSFAVGGATEFDLLIDALRANGVLLSVGIAFAGVLVAVSVFVVNTRIARRSATIEAWREWAKESSAARTRIGQAFPALRMTREDALRIRTRTSPAPWWHRRDGARRVALQDSRRDITQILNGLERIAVGARIRIVDRRLLRRIAGTRIPAAYILFEEYILVVREGQPTRPPQPRAYAELTRLATWIAGGPQQLDALRQSRLPLADNGPIAATRSGLLLKEVGVFDPRAN
ncbi:hypothetical protein J7E68_15175 [Microbacterium sp. ISL-103]|uniref:DUF4760 domain-containing protein n=1 Tax=Microbacterium sp. ISL-103 TaxID=2819156 RepID=UPI001BECD22E|nr:DUF4760 domain-containing protein [Microbacterium sp. ISL-103]MBT2475879.1 hypothetical protein [Microbacterium sp. ISL-103]